MTILAKKLDGWQQIKLGEITTKIGSGATPRGGSRSYQDYGISLIRSLNVFDFQFEYESLAFINEEQAEQLSNVAVQPQDILLNITGASVARCCMVPNDVLPARVNQHVSIVRINKTMAVPKYVLYCINSPRYKTELLTIAQGGATREALTRQKISDFEIPLPLLPIQRKIAAILSAYDDLIENNNRRIQVLEEMARTIYHEWFVNFHFPGHEKVKMVESELGAIPDGWNIRNLFDVVEVTYGFPFRSKLFTVEAAGKPIIRIRDLKNNYSNTYTTEQTQEKYVVRNGNLLVGMDGDFHICKWAGGEAYLNQRLARFRPNNKLPLYYLFLALEKPIHFFDSTVVGTTVAHLSDEDLRSIKLLVPDDALMQIVKKVFDPLFDLELNSRIKISCLRRTRDLLLPKLISGELDVSELDIATEGLRP